MPEDRDDELAELLADEDRVRDVLLAAVDGQLVPPARTDLAQIVQRGKRRARMQVLAASAAAVVLIAAVALGASVLAHWNGSNQVSTANGSSTALPVTSQTITTTPNQPAMPVFADDASQPICLYPGLAADAQKWVPLNDKQGSLFVSILSSYAIGPVAGVSPDAIKVLAARGGAVAAQSVEIYAHGQLNLVTITATAYSGAAAVNAATDSRQENMPKACTGTFIPRTIGKPPLINEYVVPAPHSATGASDYLRAQLYESGGIRYDVTEVVNPSNVPDYIAQKLAPTGKALPTPVDLPPALTANELAEIAVQVGSYS
ncbi:MAG TPA: hypothetical protein VGN81_14145 [Pseudonocardiaceae bacterium]|jgi:hypothetical protein